jgi:hypothetical protein
MQLKHLPRCLGVSTVEDADDCDDSMRPFATAWLVLDHACMIIVCLKLQYSWGIT